MKYNMLIHCLFECIYASEKEYTMPKNQLPDTMTQLRGFDDFVRTVMRDWRARGLAMAVIKENEIIYAQGFGQRDEAQDLPVTSQTLFPIASCTKAFTTAAMSKLADQGKLDWDIPVRAYIPSFLEPYKGTEFLTKGSSGMSVEFQRDASGAVTGVVATLPYGVFHASKKG